MVRENQMKRAIAVLVLLSWCAPALGAARVNAWELPGGDPDLSGKESWKACAEGASPGNGAAIENRKLVVTARPGQAGATVLSKVEGSSMRVSLALVSLGGAAGKIEKVTVKKLDGNEAVLGITAPGAAMDLVLGAGKTFVRVLPSDGAARLDVGADARYAILPDFFADDTVYDARRFEIESLSVPAENFLFQLVEGERAIVMCVWQGSLTDTKKEEDAAPAREEKEPRVDILFSGEGDARRITASRIEFLGKPVYVGILEHEKMWHQVDVSSWKAWEPTPIEWKRPFDAKWRGDFVVAEGKKTDDWHTRSQSFPFRGPVGKDGGKWWGKGDENAPMVYQEALSHILYPCFFKGDETRLALYADGKERGKVKNHNRQEDKKAAQAKKEGKEYVSQHQFPPNIYERVLIYPIDRVEATPVAVYTPVDIMRDTLGQGPCEYVLDLEGVKPRPDGGTRKLVGGATCAIWMEHIFPILSRDLRKIKEGDVLDEKKKTHLIQSLEDIILFVHAVHDRIREYKKWGGETLAFVEADAKRDEKLKSLADALVPYLQSLNTDVGHMEFEGKGTEGWWDEKVKTLIEEVKADNYKNVGSVGGIRGLGNHQDHMVARARRYVKGLRQEASLADTRDPALREFATEVRARCRNILRNKHAKEGL